VATLKNLKKSILEMEFREVLEIVKSVRNLRRQDNYVVKIKAAHKQSKKATTPRIKQPKDMKSVVRRMDDDAKQQLIKQLEKELGL
jgi:16S rRNA U1498 N3-methylase RsmE